MSFDFVSLLLERARTRPDDVYATFDGIPITFGELHRDSDAVAAALRRLNVQRGARVALMLRNSFASLAALFGIAKAGCVWVPVNVEQRGAGLRYILEHCEPSIVIAHQALLQTVRESGAALDAGALYAAEASTAADSLEGFIATGAPFAEAYPDESDLFALCYTSGTTGRPKGVQVTHRMLRLACEAAALSSHAKDGDVFFVWEPLYHIGGAQLIALPLLKNLRLAMVPRFSATRFWQQVSDASATHIHYLGGILQILLRQPQGPRDRTHKIRIAWGGGCPREIWRAFEARFGVRLHECYGMTEASSITTFNDAGIVGAVGRSVPWLGVEIRDAQGNLQPVSTPGEIVVQSKTAGAVFSGYFRNPEATAQALRATGFYTGDLGLIDERGVLFFLGRLTDSVRVKGENVSAFEVENVALEHPHVEDCAMIGVPGDIGEQDIKLFIKPKANTEFDVEKFSQWIGSRLASYQNPRYLALVADFERTPSQRIIKRNLATADEPCWDRCEQAAAAPGQSSL